MTLTRNDGKISTLSAVAAEVVSTVVAASLRITTNFNPVYMGNFNMYIKCRILDQMSLE